MNQNEEQEQEMKLPDFNQNLYSRVKTMIESQVETGNMTSEEADLLYVILESELPQDTTSRLLTDEARAAIIEEIAEQHESVTHGDGMCLEHAIAELQEMSDEQLLDCKDTYDS
jgi:hypothetical protein